MRAHTCNPLFLSAQHACPSEAGKGEQDNEGDQVAHGGLLLRFGWFDGIE